eukprot:3939461-Rhodomonas_salina.1
MWCGDATGGGRVLRQRSLEWHPSLDHEPEALDPVWWRECALWESAELFARAPATHSIDQASLLPDCSSAPPPRCVCAAGSSVREAAGGRVGGGRLTAGWAAVRAGGGGVGGDAAQAEGEWGIGRARGCGDLTSGVVEQHWAVGSKGLFLRKAAASGCERRQVTLPLLPAQPSRDARHSRSASSQQWARAAELLSGEEEDISWGPLKRESRAIEKVAPRTPAGSSPAYCRISRLPSGQPTTCSHLS